MAKKTLRVLARGEAKVPDYAAHAANITSRFIGWEFDASLGEEYVDPATGQPAMSGGHRKKSEPTTLVFEAGDPHFAEYLKNLMDGDLEPADEATAKLAKLPFKAAASAKKVSE